MNDQHGSRFCYHGYGREIIQRIEPEPLIEKRVRHERCIAAHHERVTVGWSLRRQLMGAQQMERLMKIVIIGGTGLIGSKTAERLRKKGHARGIARQGRRVLEPMV